MCEESVQCNAMHWGVCHPPDLFPPPRIYASCVAFKTPDIIPWSTYRGLRVRFYCHCHKVSVRQFPDSGCPPSFVFWIITVNVKFAWTPLAPRPRSTLLLWSPLCCVLAVYTWCISGTTDTTETHTGTVLWSNAAMLPGALRLQISLTKDQTKTQTWSLWSLRRWLVTTACLQTKTDHQDDGNGRGEMGGELARGLGLVTNVILVGVVGSEKLVSL